MRITACAWCCARRCDWALSFLSVAIVAWGSTAVWAAGVEQIRSGRQLFEHVWQPHDPLSKGDGLGPMFNERSCVACHFQGGVGGAGPNRHNVQMLTAVTPRLEFIERIQRLRPIHVGFGGGTRLVLHRESTAVGYEDFRQKLLGFKLLPEAAPGEEATPAELEKRHEHAHVRGYVANGLTLLLSERSTTPLFGLGVIDQIPQAVIEQVAQQQPAEDSQVSGRFVGRFGWRGQVADLATFVRGACAVEIGLTTSLTTQALNPLGDKDSHELDMTDAQCQEMIAFVAALPTPIHTRPNELQSLKYLAEGEALFRETGCAVCHRPTLGTVRHLYSDLLLHDMGAELEDPASAGQTASNEYYGSTMPFDSPLAAELRREWKTPPLWGLADSAPYLHDGRASTVEEAILEHGGEAAGSHDKYLQLSTPSRAQLKYFLSTLRAPKAASLARVGATPPKP